MTGTRDINDGDFVTKVTLRDEALMLLVDDVHELIFDINTKRLGVRHHLHKDTCTL